MFGMTGLYGGLFGEVARLQENLDQLFRASRMTSIRAMSGRTFPVINVGGTSDAIEVLALAPGLDPKALQITIEKGVLVLAGERKTELPQDDGISTYAQERFNGSFRRVISLPEDVDPARVEAHYHDGLLQVKVARNEASRPRRIQVS